MYDFVSIHKDTSTGYMSFTTAGGDVIAIKNIEELFIKVSNYAYNGGTYDTLYYGDPTKTQPF